MNSAGPICLLSCLLAVSASAADPGPVPLEAPGDVVRVITDQPEYCRQLAARVDAAVSRQPQKMAEVASLIRDGKTQCAAGHIRKGVHHLRDAWVILDSD